ncbi:hypothetical protein EHM76_00680 [bacterium]|nr:MAG: hypothetical protein EHM76_00680 [bacterium]
MSVHVGTQALLFDDTTDMTQEEIKSTVSRYISFLHKAKHEPTKFDVIALDFKRRFFEIRDRYHGETSEILPDVSQLRQEMFSLVRAHAVQWPDPNWTWDSSVDFMDEVFGMAVSPLGQAELPGHLVWPPPMLEHMTQDHFMKKVFPWVLNASPLPLGATPALRELYKLLTRTLLAELILATAAFAIRFDLTENFSYDEATMKITLKYMHPHVAALFPSSLMFNLGVKVVNKFHACAANDFAEDDDCLMANNGGKKFDNAAQETNSKLQKILHRVIVSFDKIEFAATLKKDFNKMSIVDFVLMVANVDRKMSKVQHTDKLTEIESKIRFPGESVEDVFNLFYGQRHT